MNRIQAIGAPYSDTRTAEITFLSRLMRSSSFDRDPKLGTSTRTRMVAVFDFLFDWVLMASTLTRALANSFKPSVTT